MKVAYTAGGVRVEVEGKDAKDCFGQVSSAMEVFRHSRCGACGSEDIWPQVRENAGNHYYELKCNACRAELGFGQRKVDGALYPRRKDKDGNWLPNGGWVKWASKANDEPF